VSEKQGFKKYAEPEAPKADPQAKGHKKFLAQEKTWDGKFADESENPLTIRQDILDVYEREGLCFKWVRESTFGQMDDKNIARHLKGGFLPVEPGDFPDIETVREGGLILMCRPKSIEQQARLKQQAESVAPVEVMKRRAGEGALDGISLDARHSSALQYNKHRVTRERIEIPKD
jgi:hypothetical protein